MSFRNLLVLLAQGDPRVVRVRVPDRLDGPEPAAAARALERRSVRTLPRTLVLDVPARVLEARSGGVLLKRYLVGVGTALVLSGGGVYALEDGFAYVLDPAHGAVTLRDADAHEVREFAQRGARLSVSSPGGGFARSFYRW